MIMAVAAGALALPGSAGAQEPGYNGTDCSYTTGGESAQTTVPVGSGTVTVYAGSGGMTGTATVVAGACANGMGVGGIDGGAAEAGAGTPAGGPGGYAIVDGDNGNVDPQGQSDGYIGVSNYETGTNGSCSGGGTGSNSGGCIGADPVGSAEVGIIACGNTSGNTWNNTTRDGCSIP